MNGREPELADTRNSHPIYKGIQISGVPFVIVIVEKEPGGPLL